MGSPFEWQKREVKPVPRARLLIIFQIILKNSLVIPTEATSEDGFTVECVSPGLPV